MSVNVLYKFAGRLSGEDGYVVSVDLNELNLMTGMTAIDVRLLCYIKYGELYTVYSRYLHFSVTILNGVIIARENEKEAGDDNLGVLSEGIFYITVATPGSFDSKDYFAVIEVMGLNPESEE